MIVNDAHVICIINGPLEPMSGRDANLNIMRHGLALRILNNIVHKVKKGQGRGKQAIPLWEARTTMEFWKTHEVALGAAGFWLAWPRDEFGKGSDGFAKRLSKIAKNMD